MNQVYFLEKDLEDLEKTVLLTYKKSEHAKKIGKFIGFNLPGKEKMFVASYSFVHHDEITNYIHEKFSKAIREENLFCAGNAASGNILRDIVFFSHDNVPPVFFSGLTKGFCTPLKNWEETIEVFGLSVVSSK